MTNLALVSPKFLVYTTEMIISIKISTTIKATERTGAWKTLDKV